MKEFTNEDYNAILDATQNVDKKTNGQNNKKVIISDEKYIARILAGYTNKINGFTLMCLTDAQTLYHIDVLDNESMLIF